MKMVWQETECKGFSKRAHVFFILSQKKEIISGVIEKLFLIIAPVIDMVIPVGANRLFLFFCRHSD
jgi:hypothetical protein